MLYVIRHGQVDTNIKHQVNGWNEEELNETGVKQAVTAGNQIKNLKFDAVFCSPMLRTRQTCEKLNIKNTPIFYDDRLKERNSKSMVYTDTSLLDKNIWYDKTLDIAYEDSEGFKSVIERVESLLQEVKNKYAGKNILFITHGDICKAIHLHFNPNSHDNTFRQDNCEILTYNWPY